MNDVRKQLGEWKESPTLNWWFSAVVLVILAGTVFGTFFYRLQHPSPREREPFRHHERLQTQVTSGWTEVPETTPSVPDVVLPSQ